MANLLKRQGKLRNGWWVLIFFAVTAAMLVPAVILAKNRGGEVPIGLQALIVVTASFVCQALRRAPLAELTGRLDAAWLRQFAAGCLAGAALMAIPAALLAISGAVTWSWSGVSVQAMAAGALLFAGVAVTEEFVFRGFVFQRLIDGIGPTLAQVLLGGYFVLSHSAGLANAGEVRGLAMANIFTASLLFGFAYLVTRSLALPIGIHFGANVTQGTILGFGVSGSEHQGLLVPDFTGAPSWLTGGLFGLEASLPGLVTVLVATLILLFRWRRTQPRRSPAATFA